MSLKFLSTFLFLSLFAFSVSAQENTDETKTTSEQSEGSTEASVPAESSSSSSAGAGVEKIEVTGSHIKRIDVEGPSPVLTLDRQYLDNTGYNSAGDVLRDIPVASFGGSRENALNGGAGTGAATTSLRGFGSGDILILLDGKRLPAIGGGTSVDLNLIPLSALERIEILKDGASAIYGSDALGGVINFITKKDFDGGSVMLRHTYPEKAGGQKTDVTATYGESGSSYTFLGVLQYKKNQPIWSRDRDFKKPLLKDFSVFGSPGTWSDDGGVSYNAGGGASACPADQVFGGICAFDFSPYSQITPETDQYSALLSGTYNLSESLKLFMRTTYVRREVKGQLAPPPDRFFDNSNGGGNDTRIPTGTFNPSTGAGGWGVGGATGPVTVFYRLVEEAGPRKSKVDTDTYSLQSGLNGYMFDTWEWEVSGVYGGSATKNVGVSGYANRDILYAMAISNPSTFNPFKASGAKDDISAALYQPVAEIKSSVGGIEAKAFGEVFELGSGPVSLAFGVSGNWQSFEQTSDSVTELKKQWGGGGASVGKGHRDFQSTYIEISALPFSGFEAQIAGRFDNYSDFGSTINPKLGVRYKPLQPILLRASWGTGFKAPSLFNLYGAQVVGYPKAKDPQTGQEKQILTLGGGNPNLKEETSESFNFGVLFQILDKLFAGVDYYITKQDSVVSDLSSASGLRDIFAVENDPNFGSSYLNSFGISVIRPGGANTPVQQIIAPNVNLSTREVKGLDFRTGYGFGLFGGWDINLLAEYSILLSYKEEAFPGFGIEEKAGFAGVPYWRSATTLGVSNTVHAVNFTLRSTGEQNATGEDQDPAAQGKTRDHHELDFRYQYSFDWKGRIVFGVKNLLGTERPRSYDFTTSGGGYLDANLYDPVGRAFYLSYTQDF